MEWATTAQRESTRGRRMRGRGEGGLQECCASGEDTDHRENAAHAE